MSQKISVLIIAQNVENTIKRTLDSLTLFDEIVVIDGGSTDKTEEICRSYENVKFVVNNWPGFIPQRNFSISQASHRWCFMIDADEAATPELVEKLYEVVNSSNPKPLYRVMRTEYFMGYPIESGFGKSSYQERLFIKERVSYGGGVHHFHLLDGVHVKEDHPEVENLDPALRVLHDPTYDLKAWLDKLPRYSSIIANEKMSKGKRTNAVIVFFSFVGTFFQILWKNRKLGATGIVIAFSEAIYRCMVKLFIYESQHKKTN